MITIQTVRDILIERRETRNELYPVSHLSKCIIDAPMPMDRLVELSYKFPKPYDIHSLAFIVKCWPAFEGYALISAD